MYGRVCSRILHRTWPCRYFQIDTANTACGPPPGPSDAVGHPKCILAPSLAAHKCLFLCPRWCALCPSFCASLANYLQHLCRVIATPFQPNVLVRQGMRPFSPDRLMLWHVLCITKLHRTWLWRTTLPRGEAWESYVVLSVLDGKDRDMRHGFFVMTRATQRRPNWGSVTGSSVMEASRQKH